MFAFSRVWYLQSYHSVTVLADDVLTLLGAGCNTP